MDGVMQTEVDSRQCENIPRPRGHRDLGKGEHIGGRRPEKRDRILSINRSFGSSSNECDGGPPTGFNGQKLNISARRMRKDRTPFAYQGLFESLCVQILRETRFLPVTR